MQGGQVIKRKAPEYKSNNAGPSNESLTKDEEDSMENQRVHVSYTENYFSYAAVAKTIFKYKICMT